MPKREDRASMPEDRYWKLAAFYVVSALVASPIIGDSGFLTTILVLHMIRTRWVTRMQRDTV